MSMVVVGSVALDSIETPQDRAEDVLGGSASFFSHAASHFGEVKIVAVVGEDFPPEHKEQFAARGIDISGLNEERGGTFRWSGRYHDDFMGRETLSTDLNVFANFHPRLTGDQRTAKTFFLANIDPDLQIEVLDQAESPRFVAFDTMNLWIGSKRDRVLDLMRRVDLTLINEEEARQMTGESQLPRAVRALHELGVEKIIVKKGEHGAIYCSPDERFCCPAFPEENLVDPTGAGDAFAGGLLGYLEQAGEWERPPLREAMVCGAAMASFSVESFSPSRLVQTNRAEIIARVEDIRRMTHVPGISLWPQEGAIRGE
jgi:sugar/nucleoside kinase (ribokinase family)